MLRRFFSYFREKESIILLYHRVFNPTTDVWDLSVSPEHFDQQLKVLKKKYRVLTLSELMDKAHQNSIPKNSVAITFDDGYKDNFTVAKPLLEHHCLPATFFICSGNIGSERQFWWDELESIFLQCPSLPKQLPKEWPQNIVFDFDFLEPNLNKDLLEKHKYWRPFVSDPPSNRAKAFLQVWEKLHHLKQPQQEEWLQILRVWSGQNSKQEHSNPIMNLEELRLLKNNPYIQIGVHTVTHPALAHHDALFQEMEIQSSKNWLESELSQKMDWLAFPYGNYNAETLQIVKKLGFSGSVTTENKTVRAKSSPFTLGRWVVPDWNGEQLETFLNSILNNS